MKCIKNNKTGDIQRVTDREAYNMVGNTWVILQPNFDKTVKKLY